MALKVSFQILGKVFDSKRQGHSIDGDGLGLDEASRPYNNDSLDTRNLPKMMTCFFFRFVSSILLFIETDPPFQGFCDLR